MRKRFDQFGVKINEWFEWLPENQLSEVGLNSADLSKVHTVQERPAQKVKGRKRIKPLAPQRLTSYTTDASDRSKPTRRKRPKRRKLGLWSVLCLSMLGIFGGVGTVAFLWLTTLPPLPDCNNISPLSAEMERLYCAREAAQSGKAADLIAGLDLVKGWSADQPLYQEAKQLLEDWSALLLTIARTKAEQGNLTEAVDIINRIPDNSPVYADAQKTVADWQAEWRKGEAIYAAAHAALKVQNWNQAAAQIPALGRLSNDYWQQQRASELTQDVLAEREAWQTLMQAQKLAATANFDRLGEAIALAVEINPNTYAWERTKTNLDLWSQKLLTESMEQWRQGNLSGAMVLAQKIPPTLELPSEKRDLVQLSHAQHVATQHNNQFQSSLKQIWGLSEAIAAVKQIQPQSPFYAIAQAKSNSWQQQIDDLTQLQFANVTASFGQRTTYELAIEQARLIAPDRPKRLQAQSLMAHWRLQIERIEDQPYLLYAKQLAEPGTIPALKEAIAIARQIPFGRALRIDAQTAIADWNQQIETIEDKPFMDQAQALAKQGKLRDAIRAAEKIRSGRALYDDAQTAIASWRTQIREALIAQDRKILNEAASLAAVEKLTLAIETASRLGPERPLYGEAQAAIAQWRAARADIWAGWEAEQEDYSEEEDYSSDEYSEDYSEEDYSEEE